MIMNHDWWLWVWWLWWLSWWHSWQLGPDVVAGLAHSGLFSSLLLSRWFLFIFPRSSNPLYLQWLKFVFFFKSVLFLGAAIAGSINPVKFYYDIGETFSYFHVEKAPKIYCTGDTVSYTCNVGYLLQGSAVLKCRKGGRSICFLNCPPERHLAFKYLKP